ncbi:Mlh1 [Scenedesmus sp. PABB004]|nr:Mlh1 [Scenedesmus sp. PABB004]
MAAAAAGPAPIQRLEDAVVHRIAAGEVVQRPASALKEMLENSLDAGATHVSVVLKEGGLKYLQIQDDGHGVALEDLPLLCVRHATSKLRAFEDLDTIATLGFRGEALASISFVAHVSVTTMTSAMPHGYRVAYADGAPLPPGPKPVAAVPGTSIIVEDMFYNMPARRRAFRPGPEEHNLCLEVVQKYAVFKAGACGFTVKRQGEARSDLHTLASASRVDVIRALHGPELAAGLLPLAAAGGAGDVSDAVPLHGPMAFAATGFCSALTHAGRRSALILFINGRPVEQGQLRRAIEGAYAAHNPKATKPWVFLDLRLPPRHVEVNLHPTKREVGFLHQQEIIDALTGAVHAALAGSMSSRAFAVNTPSLLAAGEPAAPAPGGQAGDDEERDDDGGGGGGGSGARPGSAAAGRGAAGSQRPPSGGASQRGGGASDAGGGAPSYYRPEKLVRTDHRTQTIDSFLVSQPAPAAIATAAAAAGAAPRRRASRPDGGAGDDAGGGGGGGGPLLSNASLHLQAAAAEEAAAAAELEQQQQQQQPGGEQQQGQGQQQVLLLRPVRQLKLPPVATQLSSVHELLADVAAATHGELEQLFRSHTWVGMADDRLALLQHGTRLYLVDVAAVSEDLFYQLALAHWEAPRVARLAAPLPVARLMDAALTLEQAAGRWQPEPGGSRQEVCALVEALLAQKAEMLSEYLGLTFSTSPASPPSDAPGGGAGGAKDGGGAAAAEAHRDAAPPPDQRPPAGEGAGAAPAPGPGLCLTGVPLLLEGYVPDLSCLPQLVLALARDVDWDSERACFESLARALASFYALQPLLPTAPAPGGGGGAGAGGGDTGSGAAPMEVDGGAAAAAEDDAPAATQAPTQAPTQARAAARRRPAGRAPRSRAARVAAAARAAAGRKGGLPPAAAPRARRQRAAADLDGAAVPRV